MNWLKTHWVPLAIGFAGGYVVARRGGLGGVTAPVKNAVSKA